MATLQLELTAAEADALHELAAAAGASEADLLHRALQSMIAQKAGGAREEDHLQRLRQAWGIWRDHDDLDADLERWRQEQERNLPSWQSS